MPENYNSTPPLLSVVTVVRDDPAGLVRTSDSFRASIASIPTLADRVEWIVVDGSYPPAAPITIPGIRNLRVQQPPRGIFEAMNEGLDHANGTWIYFLNAGDIWADNFALKRLLVEDKFGPIAVGWG